MLGGGVVIPTPKNRFSHLMMRSPPPMTLTLEKIEIEIPTSWGKLDCFNVRRCKIRWIFINFYSGIVSSIDFLLHFLNSMYMLPYCLFLLVIYKFLPKVFPRISIVFEVLFFMMNTAFSNFLFGISLESMRLKLIRNVKIYFHLYIIWFH